MSYGFTSGFAKDLGDMIALKTSFGFSEAACLDRAKDFDRYCSNGRPDADRITEPIVIGWLKAGTSNTDGTVHRKAAFARAFGRYQRSTGKDAYVISEMFAAGKSIFVPYIFSDDEMKGIFHEIDSYEKTGRELEVALLSAYFRLTYTCGLRPNEGRLLKRSEVDLGSGEIRIVNTKWHKSRSIVMSEDMRAAARSYAAMRDAAFPENGYFFPRPDGSPYTAAWMGGKFRKFFARSKKDEPSELLPPVRVYDLRHRFATTNLSRWLDRGIDIHSRLPYLQAYMGHRELGGHRLLYTPPPREPCEVFRDRLGQHEQARAGGGTMGKIKDPQLFLLIKNFLLVYLPVQRRLSGNTVTTYRTVLNQFLAHVAGIEGIPIMAVTFNMVNAGSVNAYLDSLTVDRGLSSSTRNNRLAALRAFVSYAAACRPEYISLSGELSAIKVRKSDRFAKVDHMTERAVEALLKEPDTRTAIGLRDQMIMVMLYDTGARIQKALGIRLCDLRLDRTPTAQLFGKGRKIRTVPLMANTVEKLKNYISVFHKSESMLSEKPLFYVERKGQLQPICDDTVRIRIQKYADAAREKCGDVPETVYPHLWRHTRAMHLYQHGIDLTLISQWLGHASIETTLVYAHADTEAKRKAIEKAMGPGTGVPEDSSNYTIDDEDLLKQLYGL